MEAPNQISILISINIINSIKIVLCALTVTNISLRKITK